MPSQTTPPEILQRVYPWKLMIGVRSFPFWNCQFLGAMLNFWGVYFGIPDSSTRPTRVLPKGCAVHSCEDVTFVLDPTTAYKCSPYESTTLSFASGFISTANVGTNLQSSSTPKQQKISWKMLIKFSTNLQVPQMLKSFWGFCFPKCTTPKLPTYQVTSFFPISRPQRVI